MLKLQLANDFISFSSSVTNGQFNKIIISDQRCSNQIELFVNFNIVVSTDKVKQKNHFE